MLRQRLSSQTAERYMPTDTSLEFRHKAGRLMRSEQIINERMDLVEIEFGGGVRVE